MKLRVFEKYLYYQRLLGARGALSWALMKLSGRKSQLFAFRDPHTGFRLVLRLGTTDAAAYEQVIAGAEYAADLTPPPEYIVDCGANIGLASLFFAARFPQAKIIAVEADASNFAMLVRNTEGVSNIVPVHAAVWCEATTVFLDSSIESAWGRRVLGAGAQEDSAAGDTVRAVTMPQLMTDHGLARIDLLKIDIEGSELELFSGDVSWMSKVSTVVIELHDRMKAGCSAAFKAASADFPYRRQVGENHFASRRPLSS